ncbi:MAG: class I SAM-dependent methyltransferase [Bacteroidetes bacterium]|nr:class I SAM-dependent methyltransferase [Bacteroidota bacterium]
MIKNIKEKIKRYKESENISERLIYNFLNTLRMPYLLLTNSRLRVELFEKWKNNNNHHQISTFTGNNRYPLLFKECTQYLQKIEKPQIISFGCSTGEEVRTLGEYIPAAIIYGIDINKWCIKQCKKHNSSTSHYFYHRTSKEFETVQNVDAIFCMAVFQRTDDRLPNKKHNTKLFTFKAFEEEILLLDRKLNKNGLLIIDFSDFNFMDTVVAKNYVPLNFENNQILRKFPLFDRNNHKVSEEKFLYRVFVKQEK